jgi:acyl-coenzyme A synthetase/AMP-(fatty) acid ligase
MSSTSLAESVLCTAGLQPDAPALFWGRETWTYSDVVRSAGQVRDILRVAGIVPGRPVCVRAEKSPSAIAVLLGCGMAGVPVLLPAADLAGAVLDSIVEKADATHVISLVGEAAAGGAVALDLLPTADPKTSGLPPAGCPLLLTTSGSTGVPKVVPLSAAGVDRFVDWASSRFGLGPGTTVLGYAPLNFDLSLLDVWATLYAGGAVELVAQDRATDGRYLAGVLGEHRTEVVQAVPMFYRLLDDVAMDTGVRFPWVRQIIVTGDVLPGHLLSRIPRLFPRARATNLYGCTETNDSVLHEVDDFHLPPGDRLPIGRPVAGSHVLLVDPDGKEVVGTGMGELLVSTPFQAHGYLDPALTSTRFVDVMDAAGTDGGRKYFRSGDLARRDESGVFHLIGRADLQVKIRGVRTDIQEIEHVLGQHPGVGEAVVVAVPDDVAGHRLHAVIRRGSADANGLELRMHCARGLPRTAIPSVFEFRDGPLPRTSTGKLDRIKIRHSQEATSANRRRY